MKIFISINVCKDLVLNKKHALGLSEPKEFQCMQITYYLHGYMS